MNIQSFKTSPEVRYWVRVVVVAVIGYATTFFATTAANEFDATNFLWGLAGAAFSGIAYAIVGHQTPIEPFIGRKTAVEVPVPPAVPEPAGRI